VSCGGAVHLTISSRLSCTDSESCQSGSVPAVGRPTTLSLTALLLAATAACADGAGARSDLRRDNGPLITLNSEANAWPDAVVEGELTERGGCLLIGGAIALFPAGTTWDPPRVRFSHDSTVEVGTHVVMGGGYGAVDDLTPAGSPIIPVPAMRACAAATGATQYAWASPQDG
jgi:hypothetical protein